MSGAAIRVEATGLVTLQDTGRVGAMRYGVSQSGPMDRLRFTLATAIAGNTAIAFEVALPGAAFIAEGAPVRLGIAATGFVVKAPSGALTPPIALVLAPGERVEIAPGGSGMWAYVAVAGLDPVAPVLSSHATNARTGLGARDLSRPLRAAPEPCAAPPVPFLDPFDDAGPVALVEGPQAHLFEPEVRERLAASDYRLTAMVDRMGYRLDGPDLPASRHDIVSDGVVEGAVQVPGDGLPIVLCADRAPTGGYPKIAVVARADRHRLTQRRPGETVRFSWQAEEEARRRWRAAVAAAVAPRPRVRESLSPEFLAGETLVDGVWVADGDDG